MILEDFIMLGTTVPEPSKSDGRIFVCSAGYSLDLRRIIRIYPLGRRNIPKRWHQYRVPVERNPKDSRDESWRIRGDRSVDGHDGINKNFTPTGDDKRLDPSAWRSALDKHLVSSIAEANAKKLSLAIIKPEILGVEFDANHGTPESPQQALFDMGAKEVTAGSKRFPWVPRILFEDEAGLHRLQLRDWGCYEWMRKEPSRYREIEQAARVGKNSTLLVGNLNHQRNAWIIISVLNGIRDDAQEDLFSISAVG